MSRAGIHHFTSLIGNRKITALLARLYARHMINFKEQTVTEHPDSIPDLMDEYVSEMCCKTDNPAYAMQIVHPLACKIAWQCLRDTFTPTETPIAPILIELEKKTVTIPAARTPITEVAASEPLSRRPLGDTLIGAQFDQLQQALSSAFPSREALAEFTRTRLNENLEIIAGGTNLAEALFKLIQWSEANGRLTELVEQAYAARPHNPELRRFVAQHTDLAPMPAEALPEETREEIPDGIGLPAGENDPNNVLAFFVEELRLLRWCKITRREVKFTLDPLSEYLAARYLVAHGLRSDRIRWNALLNTMEAKQNPEKPITGFVRALYDTCEAKGKEGPIPPDILEELHRRFPDILILPTQNIEPPPSQQADTLDQAVVSTVAQQTV